MLFRKALIDRLRNTTGAALIFICGPAGSGKTSLARQWIEQGKRRGAWYSLDEEDNRPDAFFRYLLATLSQADEQLKSKLRPLLADRHALSAESVIVHLIGALSHLSYRIPLVLDDFHHITNCDLHDCLARLIRYMPDSLQIVIVSRHNLPTPVNAVVVKKNHTVITSDDLKFKEKESIDLFRKAISNGLSVDRARDLHRHMDGWATGLQLIDLLIQRKGGRLELSSILNQVYEDVANYLIHDSLRMQPESMRQFIFTTALLDQFSPSLCVAVSGRQDALKILTRLERMNLFLIPLDADRKWYRYHHVFSEVVRHHIALSDPDSIKAVQVKAAKWLALNNCPEDALHCALQSNDLEFAAGLMEDVNVRYFETLDLSAGLRWISKLPKRVLNRRALLRLQKCGFLFILMELSDVKEIISSIENNGSPDFSCYSGDKLALCQDLTTCFKYILDIFFIGNTSAIEQFQVKKKNINLHNPLLLSYIETYIVSILISKGDLSQADHVLHGLTTVAVAKHSQFLKKKLYQAQTMSLIAKLRGRLSQAEEIIQQVLDFFSCQGNRHIEMSFYLHRHMASIYYQQNRLGKAREYAANALKYCKNFGMYNEILAGNELWLQLYLAAGEKEQAAQCINKIKAYAIRLGIARIIDSAELCAARFAIEQDNLGAAGLWSQRRNLKSDESFSLLFGMECLTQARLYYAKGQYGHGAQLLRTLRNRCIKRNLGELVLHIDILQSAVYHAMNREDKAVFILKQALVLSEGEGYIRPFVNDAKNISPVLRGIVRQSAHDLSPDFLEKVLVACNMQTSRQSASCMRSRVDGLVLTQREFEILGWVAQGFQNKEIAQKAFIAIPTVKSHVSNILVKLDVKTRTQAILKAKEMNLLMM